MTINIMGLNFTNTYAIGSYNNLIIVHHAALGNNCSFRIIACI